MADIADRAGRLVEAEIISRLSAHQRRQRGTGTVDCEDCEEPIPEKRRAANPEATRCIECQEEFEKGMRI